jgi:hypothetical protein
MGFSSPAPAKTSLLALTAVGIFIVFGACMASLAGASLIFPGTSVSRIWVLNPRAYVQLSPFGKTAGITFLLLGAILGIAAAGWFNRRVWGWRLVACIITTQILGGAINGYSGRLFEGLTGLIVAGALLVYLLQPRVRSAFHSSPRR